MKSFLRRSHVRLRMALALLISSTLGLQVTAQVNDLCGGAVTLVSGTTCSNTAGAITGATTYTAIATLGCSNNNRNDVWYRFTAKTTNPTVTLSILTGMANARLTIFSGPCGSLSGLFCGNTSVSATGLTVGTVYYIRVYCTPNATGTFNICVTDPPLPANDDCTGAQLLNTATGCSNVAGDLLNATGTTGIPGDCGAAGSPEVWFKFVAQSAFPTITLSSPGAQLTAAGIRLQLLSGTCGSMSSLACVSASSINTYTTPGPLSPLTIGATYYIRVYTNNSTMSGTAWGFNICITEQAIVDFGKAYVNVTKGAGGGTIEPNDVLEIRAIYVVKGGQTTFSTFLDTVPTNTTYVANTLRILTNEGQLYKQWTDAADTDPAFITAGSFITINLGAGANNLTGGTVRNIDKPTNFGSTCIMIVSYRVRVNAVATYGVTTINVGGGKVRYTNPNGYISNINFPQLNAMVYKNYGICANTIGSNGVLSESGGSFGLGNPKDRIAGSSKIPANYTQVKFSTGTPLDYYYGLTNNSSPGGANYSINPNDPVGANHVFTVWDIIGDHTGATNAQAGNPPADTTGGKTGGYMVVINAAYRTDTAFLDTVRNLCPNTYYEYSAWFRNICKKCSGDSLGRGPSAVGYVPTVAGPVGFADSSGVHPNLTFNINGFDYYTTGDILYTGQWIKKGFTYLTGPSQTQMIINIRNNAPGGGGNDWAMDDIGVATCTPNLDMNPSTPLVNLCYGNATTLSANVKSYFDNYTEFIWEKSSDYGATYTSLGLSGTGTPVLSGSEYSYTANGPSFIGDSSTHNNIYRLRVASTPANLSDPNCSFAALRTVQVYVNSCMWVLKADFVSVNAGLTGNNGAVHWTVVNEIGRETYEVEKSTDGIHFVSAGKLNANSINGPYKFDDPDAVTGVVYYRIKMTDDTQFKYSKIVMLSAGLVDFGVKDLVNPLTSTIACSVIIPADGDIRLTLFDMYGRAVKTSTQPSRKGITAVKMQDLGALSGGTYYLEVAWKNKTITKKIIKTN